MVPILLLKKIPFKIKILLALLVIFSCDKINKDYSPYFNMTKKVRKLHTPIIKKGLLYNRDGTLYTGSGKYIIPPENIFVVKHIFFYGRHIFLR